MPTVYFSPIGNDAPFVDSSGNPLTSGELYTYTAGSSTPEATYTTNAGSVQNANPIVLGSNGYPSSGGNVVAIWLTQGISYKFVLKNSAGTTLWTRDNVSGVNDPTAFSAAGDQWVASGHTPTYISATSFSVTGDQTSTYQAGRRIKSTNTGGTIYSTIVSSAYASVTTVTVVNDSGSLDSGLSVVSLGILTPINPSVPVAIDTYPLVSGSSDKTKKVRLEVDGLTTATTRVVTVPDADGTLLYRDVADQAVTGGGIITSLSLGTISSGTVTPDPGDRPMQHYTNNGAHTLAPSSNAGTIVVDVTNGASAGATTTSGFTLVTGAFTTTNGNKFRCFISIGNGGSLLQIQALQ